MDEEMLKRLSEMGATEEDLANPDKVKEFAEKVEAENKAQAEKDAATNDDKVLNDQLGRLRKALSKGQAPEVKPAEAPAPNPTLSELDVDNRVFIRTQSLNEAQIEVLNNYSQLPTNKGKSFESIFASKAVQAEFSEIKAEQDAKDELDTNADDDKNLETNNELYDRYVKTGKTPENEQEHRIVVEKSLKASGYQEY